MISGQNVYWSHQIPPLWKEGKERGFGRRRNQAVMQVPADLMGALQSSRVPSELSGCGPLQKEHDLGQERALQLRQFPNGLTVGAVCQRSSQPLGQEIPP